MSAADGSGGPEHEPSYVSIERTPLRTDTLLVEALIHALVEKGLLTKNDALSVLQSVVQVQRGTLKEGTASAAAIEADIQMMRRMYESFGMLEDRAANRHAEGDNIYTLRPPIHGDRPEFPAED